MRLLRPLCLATGTAVAAGALSALALTAPALADDPDPGAPGQEELLPPGQDDSRTPPGQVGDGGAGGTDPELGPPQSFERPASLELGLTGPDRVTAGQSGTWTVTVGNTGVAAAPAGFAVTLVLPETVTVSGVRPADGWTCVLDEPLCAHDGPLPGGTETAPLEFVLAFADSATGTKALYAVGRPPSGAGPDDLPVEGAAMLVDVDPAPAPPAPAQPAEPDVPAVVSPQAVTLTAPVAAPAPVRAPARRVTAPAPSAPAPSTAAADEEPAATDDAGAVPESLAFAVPEEDEAEPGASASQATEGPASAARTSGREGSGLPAALLGGTVGLALLGLAALLGLRRARG